MQKEFFYLSTCSTCKKILKELNIDNSFTLHDIKKTPVTTEQLDNMADMIGNYETLFNRKAIKFRTSGLDKKKLTNQDYRKLILQEYTFLKRPVIVINDTIYIGSAKSTIQSVKEALDTLNN